MKRPLQVYIDDDEIERLEAWVQEHGWTKSQAVRAALRALTLSGEEDPLLAAAGMVDGLPEDCSERIDRYLEETFVAEKRRTEYGKRGRRKKPGVRR